MKKYEDGFVQILLCALFAVLGLMVLAPANQQEFLMDCAFIGMATKALLLISLLSRRARKLGRAISSPALAWGHQLIPTLGR